MRLRWSAERVGGGSIERSIERYLSTLLAVQDEGASFVHPRVIHLLPYLRDTQLDFSVNRIPVSIPSTDWSQSVLDLGLSHQQMNVARQYTAERTPLAEFQSLSLADLNSRITAAATREEQYWTKERQLCNDCMERCMKEPLIIQAPSKCSGSPRVIVVAIHRHNVLLTALQCAEALLTPSGEVPSSVVCFIASGMASRLQCALDALRVSEKYLTLGSLESRLTIVEKPPQSSSVFQLLSSYLVKEGAAFQPAAVIFLGLCTPHAVASSSDAGVACAATEAAVFSARLRIPFVHVGMASNHEGAVCCVRSAAEIANVDGYADQVTTLVEAVLSDVKLLCSPTGNWMCVSVQVHRLGAPSYIKGPRYDADDDVQRLLDVCIDRMLPEAVFPQAPGHLQLVPADAVPRELLRLLRTVLATTHGVPCFSVSCLGCSIQEIGEEWQKAGEGRTVAWMPRPQFLEALAIAQGDVRLLSRMQRIPIQHDESNSDSTRPDKVQTQTEKEAQALLQRDPARPKYV